MLKTESDTLRWIHDNMGDAIRELTDVEFKDTPYTESLIAGLICRETGFLIRRYANKGMSLDEIAAHMKGDYSKRPGESSPRYHGYGFVQIDTGSYPDFIESTPLSDYTAYLRKSVEVLEEKRKAIEHAGFNSGKLGDEYYMRAILAAYNSGQGRVIKSLQIGREVDTTTFGGDYSRDVMKLRYMYWEAFCKENE